MNKYEELREVLNLEYHPIGFKLIFERNYRPEIDTKFQETSEVQKFCIYIKEAGEGKALRLKQTDSSCLITERQIDHPELSTLELNIHMSFRGLKYFLLYPVDLYPEEDYDGLILVVNPKNAMDIINAYVDEFHKPLKLVCGAQSGICSEVAYIAKRQDVNFSFLCDAAREYAGYEDNELLCGIPHRMANELVNKIVKQKKK